MGLFLRRRPYSLTFFIFCCYSDSIHRICGHLADSQQYLSVLERNLSGSMRSVMLNGRWLFLAFILFLLGGCQSWTVRDIDSLAPTAALPAQSEQGWVEARYFDDVSGSRVSALTALTRFPDNPDDVVQLNRLEGPVNRRNNYGTLVRGYITPPSDGRYRFFVSGDDETQFFFSTN